MKTNTILETSCNNSYSVASQFSIPNFNCCTAPSYVTLKVSDLAMLVGGTIDSRVLHYLWWHQGLWCNSLYIVPCANRLSWPLPDFHRVCKCLPVGQFYNMEDSVS